MVFLGPKTRAGSAQSYPRPSSPRPPVRNQNGQSHRNRLKGVKVGRRSPALRGQTCTPKHTVGAFGAAATASWLVLPAKATPLSSFEIRHHLSTMNSPIPLARRWTVRRSRMFRRSPPATLSPSPSPSPRISISNTRRYRACRRYLARPASPSLPHAPEPTVTTAGAIGAGGEGHSRSYPGSSIPSGLRHSWR